MGHLALTQALSDDVITRKPPLGQQGKEKLQHEKRKRQRLEVTGVMCFWVL